MKKEINKKKLLEIYAKTSTPQELFLDTLEKVNELEEKIEIKALEFGTKINEIELTPGPKGDKGDFVEGAPGKKGEKGEPGIGIPGKDGNLVEAKDIIDEMSSIKDGTGFSVFKLKDTEYLRGAGKDKMQWNSVGGLSKVAHDTSLSGSGTDTDPLKVATTPASKFTQLTDVPHSYSGEGGKAVYVNGTEDGLIFQPAVSSDEKVKYDVNDPTAGYVADKFVAGTGITLSEGTGADENKLKITATGGNALLLDQTTPQAITNGSGTILTFSDTGQVLVGIDTAYDLALKMQVNGNLFCNGVGYFNNGLGDLTYVLSLNPALRTLYSTDGTTPVASWASGVLVNGSSNPYLTAESDPLSLHLNQITPQTFTGGTVTGTGLLKVTAGQLGLDTSAYITRSGISAGTGISYDNSTGIITNSAPDQTVAITAGTNITSVTGTYPNFTINAATQTTDISSKADKSTTLTINGTTQDLSANRTWNVGTVVASDLTPYAKLDGTNQPFTGNLNVSKDTPVLTLTSTDDSNNTATLSRSVTSRALTLKNYVGTPTSGPLALTSARYVSTPSATFLNGATSFSISMWIKTTAYPTSWGWFESRSGAGLQGLYDGGLYVNGNLVAQVATPSNGVWHHIVGVWSSGTRGEIWVDGIKTTYANYTGTVSNNAQFYFMVDPYDLSGSRSIAGSIDEAAVWNRALTNGEIADLYNTGNGMYITGNFPSSATAVTTNLLALWHIDENTGLSLADSSGNSNTGTAYTGSTWTTGAGTIQPAAGAYQGTLLNYIDGTGAGEKGIAYIGDASSRTVIQGLTTRFNVAGVEKGQLSATGMAWTLPNTITGSSDAIQLKIVSNATQTTNPFQMTTSAGTNILSVSNAGEITLIDAATIVGGSTTGTKIGTATTQKLGFYNATPIVQVGATIDLGVALSNLGFRAAGTAYPITTSGAVTFGSLTATRIPFAGASGLLGDSSTLTYSATTGLGISTPINSGIGQTTTNGLTGTAVSSQPFQGTSYKKFIVYLTNFTSAGTVLTFPTAFVKAPYVYGDAAAIAIAVTTTTTVTLTSIGAVAGLIFVEGY